MPPAFSDEGSFYSVLGVSRTADRTAITKAYRKLALLWHPDKNPESKDKAERKFKRIAQAYEVLSDPTKRNKYDRCRQANSFDNHYSSKFDHSFRSPFDIFREFFGDTDPFTEFAMNDSLFSPFRSKSNKIFDNVLSDNIFQRRKPNQRKSYRDFADIYFDKSDNENDCSFSSVICFQSGKPGMNASSCKTTTTTKIIDGVKVVTKRTEIEGKETIEVIEDGVLKSRVINDSNSNSVKEKC